MSAVSSGRVPSVPGGEEAGKGRVWSGLCRSESARRVWQGRSKCPHGKAHEDLLCTSTLPLHMLTAHVQLPYAVSHKLRAVLWAAACGREACEACLTQHVDCRLLFLPHACYWVSEFDRSSCLELHSQSHSFPFPGQSCLSSDGLQWLNPTQQMHSLQRIPSGCLSQTAIDILHSVNTCPPKC